MRHRSTLIAVIGASLYGLLAFFIHLKFFPIGDLGVESDFYAELAVSSQRLADGQFAIANYPFKGPLYSFILVGLHFSTQFLGADWYHTAVLLNATCAVGIIILLFTMMRSVFGVVLAGAITISTVFCAEFFLHAQKASSDLLYLLLFLAAVSCFLGTRSPRRILVAGLWTGMAFLTRYSGGVLLAGGVLILLGLPSLGPLRHRLKLLGFLALGFLTVTVPWFILNFSATGNLLNDGNLLNVVLEFYPDQDGSSFPVSGFQSLGQVFVHDPQFFVSHFLGNIPAHFKQDMVQVVGWHGAWLVTLGMSGILLSLLPWPRAWRFIQRRRPEKEQGIFFAFAIVSFLAMCLVFHRPRFSLPLVPAYFALGYGFILGFDSSSWPSVRKKPFSLMVAAVALLAISFFQIQDIIRGERYYFADRPLAVLERAPLVRALAAKSGSTTLLARKPHLAHYAGLEPLAYPAQILDWDQFFTFALGRKADLIVVGEQERGIPGETMILDHLDRAQGVKRLEGSEELIVYHLDWRGGAASSLVSFPEIRGQIKSATESGNSTALFLAHFDLGLALMPLAQWEAARASLEHCLDMYAADASIIGLADHDYLLVNLSYCHLKLGDSQDGLALLGENLVNLHPTEDTYLQGLRHFVLGQMLAEMGRMAVAEDHFRIAHRAYLSTGNTQAVAEVKMHLDHLIP